MGGKIKFKKFKISEGQTPLNDKCDIKDLKKYSKSYLNHLIKADEMLASMLISLNNIYFYQQFMREIRDNIKKDFNKFYNDHKNSLIKYLNYCQFSVKIFRALAQLVSTSLLRRVSMVRVHQGSCKISFNWWVFKHNFCYQFCKFSILFLLLGCVLKKSGGSLPLFSAILCHNLTDSLISYLAKEEKLNLSNLLQFLVFYQMDSLYQLKNVHSSVSPIVF